MRRAILNEQWLNGYVVNSNLPIGAPMAWLSEVPPVGFLAFDGSEYNQEDFPELYEVIQNIPSFHSDTEGKFKIPNLKGRVLQGADTVIGELIEAGLPNITGTFSGDDINALQEYTGCFSLTKKLAPGQEAGNGTDNLAIFDASSGETKTDGTLKTQDEPHVYGNSDTVQMDAFTVYWVIKATNYVSLEKNAIDDTKTTNANAWSAEKTKAEIGTVDNKFNFSTDEIIVGKWIDGKPIYRKAMSIPEKSYYNWQFIDAIDNMSIDKVINATMYGTDNNDGVHTDCMCNVVARRYSNNRFAFIAINYDIIANQLVIEYTRTTD